MLNLLSHIFSNVLSTFAFIMWMICTILSMVVNWNFGIGISLFTAIIVLTTDAFKPVLQISILRAGQEGQYFYAFNMFVLLLACVSISLFTGISSLTKDRNYMQAQAEEAATQYRNFDEDRRRLRRDLAQLDNTPSSVEVENKLAAMRRSRLWGPGYSDGCTDEGSRELRRFCGRYRKLYTQINQSNRKDQILQQLRKLERAAPSVAIDSDPVMTQIAFWWQREYGGSMREIKQQLNFRWNTFLLVIVEIFAAFGWFIIMKTAGRQVDGLFDMSGGVPSLSIGKAKAAHLNLPEPPGPGLTKAEARKVKQEADSQATTAHVLEFIDSKYKIVDVSKVDNYQDVVHSFSDVYGPYQEWCDTRGFEAIGKNVFSSTLKNIPGIIRDGMNGSEADAIIGIKAK